jgi:hypothetical protein
MAQIYNFTNQRTGETKKFIQKTRLAKYSGINTNRIELAITNNKPIQRRDGDSYKIEIREENPQIDEIIL